jgi:hypothetical protein
LTVPARIFVAYPYALPSDDYRGAFEEVAQTLDVAFDFADELLTNQHVLDKIIDLIEQATFSLFDVTLWNPNVTLELGVAIGRRRPYFLLLDPTKRRTGVPSDLAGLDRIEYRSYTQLRDGLGKLLRQRKIPLRPVPSDAKTASTLGGELERSIVDYVTRFPGLNAYLIANHFRETSQGRIHLALDEATRAGLIVGHPSHGYRASASLPPWAQHIP